MEKMQDAASDLRGDAVGRVLEDSLSLSICDESVRVCRAASQGSSVSSSVCHGPVWDWECRVTGDEGEGGCAAGGATVRTQ